MRASSLLTTSLTRLGQRRGWARAAVAAGAIALPAQFAIAQGGPDHPELFRDVAAGQEARHAAIPAAVRQRNVRLDVDLLVQDDRSGTASDGLTLTLFEDTVVSGDIQRVEAVYGGGYIIELDVDNDPHGHVYLSVMNQSVTATVRTNDRLYQVHSVGATGQHTVSEVDETRQPKCGTPNATAGGARGLLGAPVAASSSEIVDMVVAYTDDARASYGISGILSLINLAVFETNQGYANSQVDLRVNLVYSNEVSFSETGSLSTWVSQLRNFDGVIDEVHTWRDAHGADAVCMITDSGAGFCGQAYNVMTVLSSAGAADAFNVTAAGCATGNYTFGHELGHSLGCQHDRANTGGAAIYPYCYGYRTPSNIYRTIMAYSPGSRINFWSNPSSKAPNGEVLGVTNSEENWRVLNNVASTVTAWRTQRNSGQTLVTTFKSNNGFAGNMFNITPKEDIEITALQINTSAATSTSVSARLWYRHGSYFQATSTSAGWCLIGTGSGRAAGRDRPTKLSFRSTETLRVGRTYGIYVELVNYNSSTNSLRYTNGGPEIYENNQLRLVTGVGKGDGFTSQTFQDRIWNGRVFYRGGTGTGSLSTTFAGGNRFAGNMFTVTPAKSLTINSFDVNVNGTGDVTVDVWRRVGSYTGFEGNASGWTHLGTEFKANSAGLGLATRIAVGDIDLSAGTTYSFYVLLSSYSSGGQSLEYSNGSGTYINSDMTIAGGIGTDNIPFSGNTFSPRMWNGRIHYTLKGTLSSIGSGCSGTNGTPSQSASGSPTLGSTVTYSLTRGPRRGTGFIALGNSKTFWGAIPLPVSLTFAGATGCFVYNDHDLVIGPLGLNSSGNVSVPIGISDQCGLIGVHLYTQFLLLDPGANPLGLTTSNTIDALLSH